MLPPTANRFHHHDMRRWTGQNGANPSARLTLAPALAAERCQHLLTNHILPAHPKPRSRHLTPSNLPNRPSNRGMYPPGAPGGSFSAMPNH